MVGNYNSGVSIPSSEVYNENGILQITPASTNPTFTERKLWNVFRTCGRDDQQGAVAADYIVTKMAGKKIAIVHDKTTYGKGLADETKKGMNAKGVTEVLYAGFNTGEKSYSDVVSEIKPEWLVRHAWRSACVCVWGGGGGGSNYAPDTWVCVSVVRLLLRDIRHDFSGGFIVGGSKGQGWGRVPRVSGLSFNHL